MMRTLYIDILRSIGLLLVILAHIKPNGFVYELRSFDVVLMVFVSGLTFSMKSDFNYWHYIVRRTSRLIIPTYIFLSVYFLVTCLYNGHFESLSTILLSYSLIGGIGYVWIIRIFLLIMIVAPLLYQLAIKLSSPLFLSLCVALLLACDILTVVSSHVLFPLQRLLEIIVIPILGYSVPYCVALRLKQSKNVKEFLLFTSAVLVVAGIVYFYRGDSLLIHSYKTPPRTIYLAYGMMVSLLLYYISQRQYWSRMSNIKWGGYPVG